MKFKLKRKDGMPRDTFSKDEYNVYENKEDNGYEYAVVSDSGTPYYFNIKNGKVERGAYLEARYWEVIRIKEGKKMDQFKVGETYLCTRGGSAFKKGKLYFVVSDDSAPEPYIIADIGTKWFKHDIKDIYSEFEKLNDEPKITALTLSVENTKIMIDAEKLRAHIMKLGLDGSQITSYLTGYIQAAKGEM